MIQYRPEPGSIDLHQLNRQLCHEFTRAAESDRESEADVEDATTRTAIVHISRQLIAMTKSLFPPGAIDIRLEVDPDDPTDEYIVFSVSATGEHREIFDREDKWHEEASRIVGERATWLSLCVYPR